MVLTKTGIVVIDMQTDFLFWDEDLTNPKVPDLDRQTRAIQRLVQYGGANKMPTYLVEFESFGNTINSINGLPYEAIFRKKRMSALSSEEFCRRIADDNIQEIIIAGVNAGLCISASIEDCLKRNLPVRTSKDLVNDKVGWIDKYGEFFRTNSLFYETHYDLIASLQRERLAA